MQRGPSGHTLHRRARAFLWVRDRGVCALCGEFDVRWEADHVVPWAEGGMHAVENHRTLCRDCHRDETVALNRRLAARRRQGEIVQYVGPPNPYTAEQQRWINLAWERARRTFV